MVESMDPEHRHMLRGGSVSNFFLRDSLTLCHPIFVGGLYGLMISIVLLPPMAYGSLSIGEGYSQIGSHWLFQMLVIVAMVMKHFFIKMLLLLLMK